MLTVGVITIWKRGRQLDSKKNLNTPNLLVQQQILVGVADPKHGTVPGPLYRFSGFWEKKHSINSIQHLSSFMSRTVRFSDNRPKIFQNTHRWTTAKTQRAVLS